MKYGSVCSGIEAATMAWHPLGWTPAFFSEIEAFPSAVLAHHYGSNMPGEPLAKNGIPNYGDFTQIGADAGPIDLLVGGTPCQSFSVAGKRLGLDDPRGNLALEYLSLARRLRARWIVWENVPGVVSSVTDEEDGEGGIQSGIEGREAGDEWIEESDFATFLSFVRECGYGFAYRVLDAQYVRVDGFGRAVPQRRRRVFVVGYLGDWRRAAAVLLEPQGMRGDSAPRREQGKGTAGTIDASAARSRGAGVNPGMITSTGSVAHCLNAGGMARQDYETETMVAHTLKGEGFDASEDGTGRGTPIVPVAYGIDSDCIDRSGEGAGGTAGERSGLGITKEHTNALRAKRPNAVAFAQNTRDEVRLFGGDGQIVGALAAEPGMKQQSYVAQPSAVAFDMRGRDGGAQFEGPHDTANIRAASGGSSKSYVAQEWAVRRLTPVECERLQGFPDNFTNVPWGKKETSPDGPRYKALGNSMAVNVMRWIGRRIEMVEKITKGEAA